MKRFCFSLATVLKVRQRNEERMRSEVLRQRHRLEEAQAFVRGAQAGLKEAEERTRAQRRRGCDLEWQRAAEEHRQGLQLQLRSGQETQAACQQQFDMVCHEWIQARRAVRVLERLQEKQRARYRKEASRQEQKRFDEIGMAGKAAWRT